jgi:hypothetical protein
MKRTPVLPTSLKLRRTSLSLGVVGLSLLLLFPFALNAGPVLSVLDPYPFGVLIEATAKFKAQYVAGLPQVDELPQKAFCTSFLMLENSFFSLQETTSNLLAPYSSSQLYSTVLALQNVTRAGINVECTTAHKNDAAKKHVWPLTIPLNRNLEESKELDLLDDAGEKVTITIKSNIEPF